MSKKTITRERVIEMLESWARYAQGRIDGGIGWPKKVMLGKLLDGMPGTNCPRCSGKGRITIKHPIAGEIRSQCPICDGEGRVKLDPTGKVNPALIHGSGPRQHYDDDPQSQRIDWLICTELTEDQRSVVIAEFRANGNRNMKIAKLRIRHSTYNELLDESINVFLDKI